MDRQRQSTTRRRRCPRRSAPIWVPRPFVADPVPRRSGTDGVGRAGPAVAAGASRGRAGRLPPSTCSSAAGGSSTAPGTPGCGPTSRCGAIASSASAIFPMRRPSASSRPPGSWWRPGSSIRTRTPSAASSTCRPRTTTCCRGVTTLTEGNDGASPWPIGRHLARVADARISPNWAVFAGQGTIRRRVLGSDDREPTPDELERMRGLVTQAMEQGAFGLSTGLFYVPGSFTGNRRGDRALARVAARPRRHLHLPHARRGAPAARLRARDDPHRRGGRHSGPDDPPQGDRPRHVGRERREPGAGRRRPRAGRRHHHRSVPVRGIPDLHHGRRPAVGAKPGGGGSSSRACATRRRGAASGRRSSTASTTTGAAATPPTSSSASAPGTARSRGRASPTSSSGESWRRRPPTAADLVMELVERGGARAIYHAMDEADVERIMQHPGDGDRLRRRRVGVRGECPPSPRVRDVRPRPRAATCGSAAC